LREERVPVMREAQEVEDEEHEQILERVCAIDVAKASGKVCTRVPHPSRPRARRTRVWDVDATTNAILELGDYLAGEGIEKVTLESASVIRGRRQASGTAGDSPLCPFLHPSRTGYLGTHPPRQTADHGAELPATSRRCALDLPVADAHATA
jgi:hypothetical protein